MLALTAAVGTQAATSDVAATRWTDRYLRGLAGGGRFSGVVLVARVGKPVFVRAYGKAVVGWNVANTVDTSFEIASLTKQFTGAAILELAARGLLSVDDPVARYYAAAPASWAKITIHHLLTHTSGLPNNGLADFNKGLAVPYSPEELIATFRDRPLVFEPGSAWAYTNTEYYLLAYVIERVSGQSYGAYLRDQVLARSGMNHSSFASTLEIGTQRAEGYARDGSTLRHRNYFDRSLELGAGGIVSTAADMLRWNNALDAGRVLDPRSRARMFTAYPPGQYGYGWFIESAPRRREFHEGSDPGFAAFEARYPDDGLLVIVLANLEDAPVREIEKAVADRFLTATGDDGGH